MTAGGGSKDVKRRQWRRGGEDPGTFPASRTVLLPGYPARRALPRGDGTGWSR